MATVPAITVIPKTECVGNSLVTINTNYDNIKNSFTSVNTDLTTINSTLNTLTTFFNSISTAQLAKAWVKFNPRQNSSGAPDSLNTNRKIENSYNVASVLREDTGIYLTTLTSPIGNEFSVCGITSPLPPGTTGTDYTGVINLHPTNPFPSPGNQSCRIIVRNLQGAAIDPSLICLTFFNN
jgi:hypothetical protein